MASNDHVPSTRLSRAGREALEEHLEAERQRILFEATRLSDGAPLSAFDIVNAVDLISARERELPVHRYARTNWRRSRSGFFVFMAIPFLAMAIATVPLLITLDKTPTSDPWQGLFLSIVAGGSAVGALVCAVLAVRFVQRENRYSREAEDFEWGRLYREIQASSHMHEAASEVSDAWMIRTQSQRATGAFIASWIMLEEQLREIGSAFLGIPPEDARRYPIGELLRSLQREEILTSTDYQVLRELLALRNAVLHGGDFEPSALERADAIIPDLRDKLKFRVRRPLQG